MKKLVTLALVLVLCLGLAACGGSSAPAASTPANNAPAATEAPAAQPAEVWKSGDTVNFVIPARAGGGSDMIARYVTAGLQELYPDVNFIVTNYDTSEVGMQEIKKAKGDGLTLTVASCVFMDNYLSGSSQVNPMEDLVVATKFTDGGPQAWIARADAPYNNMVELAAYIKDHPMELTAGVAVGGTSHIIWYSCLREFGVADMVNYVQCASESDKLTMIASNSLDISNCSIRNADGYYRDGRLKILGLVGPVEATRDYTAEFTGYELDDSYLSMPEQGLKTTWEAGAYIALPASASPEVVQAIAEKCEALKDNQTFIDGMKALGSMGTPKNLADSQADWQAEWDFQEVVTTEMGLNTRG